LAPPRGLTTSGHFPAALRGLSGPFRPLVTPRAGGKRRGLRKVRYGRAHHGRLYVEVTVDGAIRDPRFVVRTEF